MKIFYGWVVVAAGGFMGCVAIGAVFTLPVFQAPMALDTGWSRTGISLAMTLNFLAMGTAAFFWGMALDRFGPRPVLLAGSSILGLGLVLASRARSVTEFQLLFGVLVGVGGGAIFAPLMATVAAWFERHRSLAISLVSAGMGIAPMTVAPIAAELVSRTNWRFSQLVIGLAVWALLLPASFLIRRAPAAAAAAGMARAGGRPSLSVVFTSPQFLVLAATFFLCCGTHSGPLFHTVSYAISCGLPMLAAVSIYSVEGLAGLAGRLVIGLLADRFGARRIFVFGLVWQAFAAGSYMFARTPEEFYTVAVAFGFAYAGVMPLYAVLVRENFPVAIIGTVVGACSLASSLGMATGPVLGGLIFDHFNRYSGLYIGAFATGLVAAAVMLTFRPARPAAVPA
jgi:MFS family permease